MDSSIEMAAYLLLKIIERESEIFLEKRRDKCLI